VLEDLHAEALNHIRKHERSKNAAGDGGKFRELYGDPAREGYNEREHMIHQPQYSEGFVNNPPIEPGRHEAIIPEMTYGAGAEWQDVNFDRFGPGGGILGSME
jgi:hypothetical protein